MYYIAHRIAACLEEALNASLTLKQTAAKTTKRIIKEFILDNEQAVTAYSNTQLDDADLAVKSMF